MEGFSHEAIHKLELDVTNDESVHAAVKTVIEREGQIDILVNNAGMSNSGGCASFMIVLPRGAQTTSVGAVIDIGMDEIIQTFNTNVFSIVRMAKAVIPHMAARKTGMIVTIGSIGGHM